MRWIPQTRWYCKEYTYPLPYESVLCLIVNISFSIFILYHMQLEMQTYIRLYAKKRCPLLTTKVTSVQRQLHQDVFFPHMILHLYHRNQSSRNLWSRQNNLRQPLLINTMRLLHYFARTASDESVFHPNHSSANVLWLKIILILYLWFSQSIFPSVTF